MSITKKKKHVSKKNKKDWRKHCDITDVEAFLEDQRLDERLGKFETKPDSDLFVVDTAGNNQTGDEKDEKPISAKLRKRAQLAATPKCFEILLPTSKVPDPNAKRNTVNPIGSKPTALSKLTEKKKFQKGIFQKKLEVARKNRRDEVEKKKKRKMTRQNFNKNLWGGDLLESKGIPSSLCEEFISTEAQLHNVLPEKRLRTKPPLAKTVVTRAAVETPHPGISYNPTYQEHQNLLTEVVQHEKKMMKREAHLLRVTNGMFSKVTQQQKENQWQEEMSVGLPQPHDPKNAQPGSNSEDNEYKAVNPPVKNKKKDHKARRKQKERLVEKERLKREKIDKQKITDLYKLRKLESSVLTKEQTDAQARTRRAAKRAEVAATAAPMLNAHKTPRKEPDFVEPAQLTGDLRKVAATANLLRDRFESLQRRGALAASKVMMKKKMRLKSYFKPGHKVTEKDIERYVNPTQNGK